MSPDERIEELLLRRQELLELGKEPSVEELCCDDPDLVEPLRESILVLDQMAWLDAKVDAHIQAGRGEPEDVDGRCPGQLGIAKDGGGHCQKLAGRALPMVLGDYTVLRLVGAGGMGRVYEAVHRRMQRMVALKVVREDAVASPAAIARFHRETKAAAKLAHPNIVTTHDAGEAHGICYLVMELVDGHDLSYHVDRHGPLEVEQAVDYVMQAARGLAHAHGQGITHRDIKPANLMLDRNGSIKVLDMGLARFREASGPDELVWPAGSTFVETERRDVDLTHSGPIRGTIAYMAPEQKADSSDLDQRADVYSLGCTLYFLLTAAPPRTCHVENTDHPCMSDRLMSALRKMRPEVSPALVAVLGQMTAWRPEDRPSSMNEVIESLQAALHSDRQAASRRARRRTKNLAWAAMAAVTVALVAWVTREYVGNQRTETCVSRLLQAKLGDVPRVVSELGPYRRWADRQLQEAYDVAVLQHDSRRQVRASLGLLPVDFRHVDNILQQMLTATSEDLPVLRDALAPHREALVERLWSVWRDARQRSAERFRAAVALATYAPRDPRWTSHAAGELAVLLVAEPARDLPTWAACLWPVRSMLEPHLEVNFRLRGPGRREQADAAAQVLAIWLADEPEKLVNLLLEAAPTQFAVLLRAARSQRDAMISRLETELAQPAPHQEGAPATWARQQAAARAALFGLGRIDYVWPALSHTPNPTMRSYLIQRLSHAGGDPGLLANQLWQETDVSIRRALLLALGAYPADALSSPLSESLIQGVKRLYRDDPDPGIHAAAEWLLRNWGQDLDPQPINGEIHPLEPRHWYVNGEGQTFVVVSNAVKFIMGSENAEPGTRPDEMLRPATIPRAFAISSKEVTVEEFGRFLRDHPELAVTEPDSQIPGVNLPQTRVTWRAAVAYCRWLSLKEGIPDEDLCYPPVTATTEFLQLPADFLDRKGYRLPTEAEWEYACRADSRVRRFFGDPDDLIDEYAWNSRDVTPAGPRPVGSLKPNDLGLFDVYGNVMEWCHHVADDDWPDFTGTAPANVYPGERFQLRGASHRNRLNEVRSAHRFRYKPGRVLNNLGIRLAQTLPTPSLTAIPRGQPLWGQAEFRIQGPDTSFVVKQIAGDVVISPDTGSTPAWVRVTARDGQARSFSCIVETTDGQETVSLHGLLFSAVWNMRFFIWDRTNADSRGRPDDWDRLVASPPLAVRNSTHLDFDWGVGAPTQDAPRDFFALEATTEVELPAGQYELWAIADNGVRVFIDGIQQIDFNMDMPESSTSNRVKLALDHGIHSFRVEYYESRDLARLQVGLWPLEWKSPAKVGSPRENSTSTNRHATAEGRTD